MALLTGKERIYISYGGAGPDVSLNAVSQFVRNTIGGAAVANGQAVTVRNSTAAITAPATARVTGNTLNDINLGATTGLTPNGANVTVQNSAGNLPHTGTANVAAGVLAVRLAATATMLDNGTQVQVRNSTGSDAHTGSVIIASGVLTGINLTSTVAMVDNGDQVTVTGTGTTFTATVTNGVLTGGTLS